MAVRKVNRERVVIEEKSLALCDTCGASAELAPELIPLGRPLIPLYPEPWVLVMTVKSWRLEPGHAHLVFCSWKCLTHYAKNQVDQ